MGNINRHNLIRAIFVLTLLGVIWGWLLVIQRMIQNDTNIAESRVREAEERYLESRANILYQLQNSEPPPIPEGGSNSLVGGSSWGAGKVSGVWTEKFVEALPPLDDFKVIPWPESGDPKTSQELVARETEFSWGHIENGRDRLGSLLLKFSRNEGANFSKRAEPILFRGILGFHRKGRIVSPGFRLLLIKEYLKHVESSAFVEKLMLAEEIQAVEGRIEELETPLEEVQMGDLKIVYLKNDLTEFLQATNTRRMKVVPELELSSEPPNERNWIRINGLKRWPYLSLKNGLPAGSAGLVTSEQAVSRLGYLTMTASLVVIGAAIWIGRQELKKARARTDLAASVAHELRTPLAGQRVVLESLQMRKEYDEEYLSMALRENQRLGDLAEEFLTFSRLERGILEVQLKPLELSEVIEPVVAGFREQRRDEIRCELDDAVVMADEAAVATIARNLMENAWKYSDDPREISISSVSNEAEIGFSVTDNGIGLSKADQNRIFRQFYRVDQRLSRSREGLGIGLSIVRRLVDAMEGRLEVESELGKGSAFTVYLKKGGAA